VASRRKRGPVTFRLRLSAGLALSIFVVALFIRLAARNNLIVNIIGICSSDHECRLWVASGRSRSYQPNGRFRGQSGRQKRWKYEKLTSANGHKRTPGGPLFCSINYPPNGTLLT